MTEQTNLPVSVTHSSDEEVTESLLIRVDGREHLISHIEGLQRVLSTRNEKIAELEAKLKRIHEEGNESESFQKGFDKGWKACASHLDNTVRDIRNTLEKARTTAGRAYTYGIGAL